MGLQTNAYMYLHKLMDVNVVLTYFHGQHFGMIYFVTYNTYP